LTKRIDVKSDGWPLPCKHAREAIVPKSFHTASHLVGATSLKETTLHESLVCIALACSIHTRTTQMDTTNSTDDRGNDALR
jgi:hypothetical protein